MTPKDLNFVGYTYKNFEAVKGLRYSFGMRPLLKYGLFCRLFMVLFQSCLFCMLSSENK